RGDPEPEPLDRALGFLLLATTAGFVLLNFRKDTPMRGFGLLALAFCVLEWRDLRQPAWTEATLLARHLRYMLGSYFYVLTVLSIVHLPGLKRNVKWLWPMALGIPVMLVATREASSWLRGRRSAR